MVALRSPGVVVREQDLTTGRADISDGNIAAFSAPFTQGPIGVPVRIQSEAELIEVFGEPNNSNSEYFLCASNFLLYGGTLSVTRVPSTQLKNATARLGQSVESISVDIAGGKYVSSPTVTIAAPDQAGGTQATATAQINAQGEVFLFDVTEVGSGYSAPPTITVAPVGEQATINAVAGTTAVLTSLDAIAGGAIPDATYSGASEIDNQGSGYSAVPTVTVTSDGSGSVPPSGTATIANGQVTSITIDGGDYTGVSSYSVTISDPTGLDVTVGNVGTNYDPGTVYNVTVSSTGTITTQFAATAQVGAGGAITGLNITNFGNYGPGTLTGNIPAPGTTATGTANLVSDPVLIERSEVYEASYANNNTATFFYASKTAGDWGNNLRICTVDRGPSQSLYFLPSESVPTVALDGSVIVTAGNGARGRVIDQTVGSDGGAILHIVHVDGGNVYTTSPSNVFTGGVAVTVEGTPYTLKSGSDGGVDSGDKWYSTKPLYAGSNVLWNSIAARPGTTDDAEAFSTAGASAYDTVHLAVVDEDGGLTGTKGTLLETFTYLSKANDARGPQGGSNYYKDVVSTSSNYIYVGDTSYDYEPKTYVWEPTGTKAYALTNGSSYPTDSFGTYNLTSSDVNAGYAEFVDPERVTIDYVLMGPGLSTELASKEKASYISSIATNRKDCIAFVSPHRSAILSDSGAALANKDIVDNIKSFYSSLGSSSYVVLDSNYKYIYDRWTDVYRYIPCNPDIAGLVADTAIRNEPWFSPAGFNRGGIRNLAKLAWSPGKSDRDELYANRINPIAIFPGQGAVLFGDKTGLSNPSAFDRINVRKLFLVVERAVESAAQAQLFEINDATTRNSFRAIVEPFLRDVQARRGIVDFEVVCDASNNTPAVIDANEFVADIFIQPSRSINFVRLTFTATRTGISFAESTGR